ncbi:MAG: glycerol-3-phosphate acyltransferase [Anaerolineales bacterium]|nr:MAG: glycerol-3-phosphate acyltransferase [Anaerolineales bacterium]
MYNETVAFVIISSGYLLGSIPSAYIAGRVLRGIDLRRYGSGTVSGSMVWEHVGRWAIVPVGLFDIIKASLPTWLALRLGLSSTVAAAAGLAAVVGHIWPLFLDFHGGRGLSTMLGIWLVLFPPGAAWMLLFLFIGWRLRSAVWVLIGLGTLPVLSHLIEGPDIVTPLSALMLGLTFLKRLEANRRPLTKDLSERIRVILRRLFLDRDIPSHEDWIRRTPGSDQSRRP